MEFVNEDAAIEKMSEYERRAWTQLISDMNRRGSGRPGFPFAKAGRWVMKRGKETWDAIPGSESVEVLVSRSLGAVLAVTVSQGLMSVDIDRAVRKIARTNPAATTLVDVRALDLSRCDVAGPRRRQGYALVGALEGAGSSLAVTGAVVSSTVSGGVTAGVAIAAIAVDAMAILGGQGRIVGVVAASYGFDVRAPEEELFALGVLSYASATTAGGKAATLSSLSRLTQTMMRQPTWEQLSADVLVNIVKTVYLKLGFKLTHEKLAQAIPILGVIVNVGLNIDLSEQTFRRATAAYRLRFLSGKYGIDPALWVVPEEMDTSGDSEGLAEDLPLIDKIIEDEDKDKDT